MRGKGLTRWRGAGRHAPAPVSERSPRDAVRSAAGISFFPTHGMAWHGNAALACMQRLLIADRFPPFITLLNSFNPDTNIFRMLHVYLLFPSNHNPFNTRHDGNGLVMLRDSCLRSEWTELGSEGSLARERVRDAGSSCRASPRVPVTACVHLLHDRRIILLLVPLILCVIRHNDHGDENGDGAASARLSALLPPSPTSASWTASWTGDERSGRTRRRWRRSYVLVVKSIKRNDHTIPSQWIRTEKDRTDHVYLSPSFAVPSPSSPCVTVCVRR